MATYKKRGQRPKSKKEEIEIEEIKSTTAGVFNTLDQGASKTEQWIENNQRYVFAGIAILALGVLGYFGYQQYILKPKEIEARNESFQAIEYFEQALNSSESDSLYTLALEGAQGKYGLLDIIDNYSGTQTANLAKYQAGMAYLNMNKYEEAIEYLDDYSTDNVIFSALATGGIGDAFAQLKQYEDALDYYDKAIKKGENEYTTPLFLLKAGHTALKLGDAKKGLKYFTRIKEEFSDSEEARNIDVMIGLAEYSSK